MALILNLETATTVCSAALAGDGKVIEQREINNGYTHAENLTVFMEEIISSAKMKWSDIDAVAVSRGPGSYTGLRIGVSTAKGLCMALDKPLIAVNTLLSMTAGMIQNSQLKTQDSRLKTLYCSMLDARRMEVYCAVYDLEENEVKPTSARIIDEHSFSDLLAENKMIFFGDGAEKCKPFLKKRANAIFIDNVFPSAKNMAAHSERSFVQKKFEDVAYFEPFYLKDFVGVKKNAH